MIYNLTVYFVMFMILAVIGYFVEVVDYSLEKHHFTMSRGFLVGPYIPIYGVGALLMYFLLSRYKEDIAVLFILSMFLCSFIEYMTSFVMEKMFNLRWWDYSDKKFNINGRVYLLNSVLFGIAGVLVCCYLGPWLHNWITSWGLWYLYIIGGILFVVFWFDFIISNVIVTKLKHRAYEYSKIDATSEIRERILFEIKQHIVLYSRVFQAFPNIFADKRFRLLSNLMEKAKKELNNLKDKFRSMIL